MRKIIVKFQIKSLDTNNSFVANGELKNDRIKFIDNENNTNYIIFQKNIVEYYKKGNMDMKYKFILDTTTEGEYTLEGYKFVFEIMTKEIIKNDEYLSIKYDLYQNKELINKTEIVLEYTFLEEDQK